MTKPRHGQHHTNSSNHSLKQKNECCTKTEPDVLTNKNRSRSTNCTETDHAQDQKTALTYEKLKPDSNVTKGTAQTQPFNQTWLKVISFLTFQIVETFEYQITPRLSIIFLLPDTRPLKNLRWAYPPPTKATGTLSQFTAKKDMVCGPDLTAPTHTEQRSSNKPLFC